MEKTDDKAVGRESDKFMLRLPDGMRERIAEAAKENNRSMNSEIVARLERSFNVVVEFQTPEAAAGHAVKVFEAELKKGVGEAIKKLMLGTISVTRPDHDHLSSRRKTPIDFPESIEGMPPPPGKPKKK